MAVKEHPRQIEVLDYAELRGITPAEVRALQREMLGIWRPLPGQVRAVLARSTPHDKTKVIPLLLGSEATHWGLPGIPAA